MSTIIQPEGWAAPKGFSNGLVATGRLCFIAGQIGNDQTKAAPVLPPSFGAQFAQALTNVLSVLRAAGGRPEQLARLTVYVTDKREYLACLRELGATWRALVGTHYPAMALVQVSALVVDEAKVELEATAVLD